MSAQLEHVLRRTLKRTGVYDHAASYLKRVATRYYAKRLRADAALQRQVNRLRTLRPIEQHYAHTAYEKPHEVLSVSLYLGELTKALEARLRRDGPDLEQVRVLDVGDPDGLVLQSLGARHGISLNILEACTRQVTRNGGTAVRASCEQLPFASASFDCVFCFETLEHLESPITGLKELARVAKQRLYLAIPWVRRTVIREDNHDPKQPEVESHVFEFSHADFIKIVTHAKLTVTYHQLLEIVPRIYNPVHLLLLRQFYFPSNYPRFQLFELAKTC